MEFHEGSIDGVIWKPLSHYHDARGWLCELFRHDEIPAEFHPVMAYISMTKPGVARGPHEHVDQADCFCFLGPSNFKVYLWDSSPRRRRRVWVQGDIEGGGDRSTDVADRPGGRGSRLQERRRRSKGWCSTVRIGYIAARGRKSRWTRFGTRKRRGACIGWNS